MNPDSQELSKEAQNGQKVEKQSTEKAKSDFPSDNLLIISQMKQEPLPNKPKEQNGNKVKSNKVVLKAKKDGEEILLN